MRILLLTIILVFCQETNAQDFEATVNQGSLIGLTTADFDGDGYYDVAGRRGDNLVLQINNAASEIGFTESIIDLQLETVWLLSSEDLDDDGDIDIVVPVTDNFDLYALMNDGSGNFTASSLGLSGTSQHEIIDIDMDGDVDIVGIDVEADILQIYENTGNANFSQIYSQAYDYDLTSYTLADLNDNGTLDVIIGYDEFFETQIVVLYNNGNNLFTEETIVSDDLRDIRRVKATDINIDGKMDILALTKYSCVAWLNEGNMSFSRQDLFQYEAPGAGEFFRNMVLADFNRDSRIDILVGDNAADLLWYKNLGNLNFERRVVGGSSPILSFTTADLDNDGDQDVVGNTFTFFWYENLVPMDSIDTAIRDINPANDLVINPNPASSSINFENLDEAIYRIQLFSAQGELVHSSFLSNKNFDISFLQNGIYVIKILDQRGMELTSRRLVKIE